MKVLLKVFMVLAAVLCFGSTDVKADGIVGTVTGLEQVDASSSSATVEWNSVVATGDVHYDIQYSSSSTGPWAFYGKEHAYRTRPKESIGSLTSGKRFYVRVRAYIRSGDSYSDGAWSQPIDIVTKPSSVDVISNQTDCTTSTISLSWNSTGSDIYRIYYKGEDGVDVSIDTDDTSIVLSNLRSGSAYQIRVVPAMKSSTFIAFSGNYSKAVTMKTLTDKPVCTLPNTFWNIGVVYVQPNNYGTAKSDGFEYELVSNANKEIVSGSYSGYASAHITNKYFRKFQFFKGRVRNFVVLGDGRRVYTPWSDWGWYGRNPDIAKILKRGDNYKLTWKAMKGASNYTVYASTKEHSGYKKIVTTKKTSYVVRKFRNKKLSPKKRYYFYVIANKKVGKKVFKTEADKSFYLR